MLLNYTKRVIGSAMTKLLTVSDVIEGLTPGALEKALGVSVQAVSNWKQRGAIPARHWAGVAVVAKDHPTLSIVTLEYLAEMHRAASSGAQRERTAGNHVRPGTGSPTSSRGLRTLMGGG